MANVKILSKTVQYGLILQADDAGSATAFRANGTDAATNWHDPGVAATDYRQVQYDLGSVVFDPAVTIDQYQSTAQNGIHMEDAQFFIDSRSGLPTMTFSMPADQKTLAVHIAQALLGAVTEGSSTPFSKSIVCAGLTGNPDFSLKASELVTLSMTDKASADDGIILEDAILNDMVLSWDLNSSGIARLCQLSGTWIGTELNFEQTMTSSSTVTTTLTPYEAAGSFSFSTLTVDAVDWSGEAVRGFTFEVNNNVTTRKKDTAGKAGNYDITPEYKSTILMDYTAVTEKALNDFQEGDLVVATWTSATTATSDGGLSFAMTKGRLMSQPFEYNDEFLDIQLDIQWFADGATTPVTSVVTDTLD